MGLIESVMLLLLVSIILGEFLERFNITKIVGELGTGIILGPAVLGLVQPSDILSGISEIALYFIILLIGIEVTTETLIKNIKPGLALTISSFFIPVSLMITVSYYILGFPLVQGIIVSISIGIPSISIVSILLRKFELLKINSGHFLLSSVILTDVCGFIIASTSSNPSRIPVIVTGLVLFFVAYFIVDYEVRKHSKTISSLLNTLEPTEQGEGRILAVVVIGGLAVSVIFEAIGITFVLGAFFAGMLISDVVVGERLQGVLTRTLNRLNDSFFIPVFFAVSGLSVVVPTLHNLEATIVLIAITAIVGAAGSWVVSRKLIDNIRPKSVVGILGGRGSVGIIIASISLASAVISQTYFTDVVFGTVVISLIFPAMIRKADITLPAEPQKA